MSLFERVAAASWGSEHSSPPSFEAIGLLRPLEGEERSELDAMEESLPAEAILMFRTMARRNVSVDAVIFAVVVSAISVVAVVFADRCMGGSGGRFVGTSWAPPINHQSKR